MPRYNVEYAAHVYVTVPVDAASRDEAEQFADKILPKYPVVAELSDMCPAGLEIAGPGKYFEIHEVFGAGDDCDGDLVLDETEEIAETLTAQGYPARVETRED